MTKQSPTTSAPSASAAVPAPEVPSAPRLGLPRALVLVLVSVALLVLAVPPLRLSWLAWFALVPALVAMRHQGAKRGALLGFVLGFFYNALLLYWLKRFGGFAPWGAALPKSFFFVLMGMVLGAMRPRHSLYYALTAACAWLGQEYLEASGSVGFTLGMLANTQARHPLWLQINSLFGSWTLSLVLGLVNATLADIVWQRREAAARPAATRPAWLGFWRAGHPSFAPFVLSCALIVVTFVFGLCRLMLFDVTNDRGLKVGLVQLSAAQEDKFDPDKAPKFLEELFALSRQTVEAGCSVVVWPETSVPYNNFARNRRVMRTIGKNIRDLNAWFFMGTVARDKEHNKRNRMYSFNPQGQIQGHYDKEHLVPFGEFLPLEKWWPDWRILDQIMHFAAGKNGPCLHGDGVEFGTLICFETMTTTMPRQRVLNGAEVLVVPTNDAWFDTTAELPAHFDMAIMRAVETGRYTMQVGNTGISGYITPLGEVLQESQPEEKIAMSETVYPRTDLTLYVWLGDVLPCLALLWVVIFLFDRPRHPSHFWAE